MATITTNKSEPNTVSVTKRSEFSETGKAGGLLFPSELYNAKFYCDLKKIRKAVPELAGQRIYKVLTTTENHPNFRNVVNDKITYKQPMCCEGNHPNARISSSGNAYVCDHPVGHVIIVVCG